MSNDEIILLIGKIRERYDKVYEPSGNIVRIEVDLLQADIRELYEKTALLSQVSGSQRHFPEPEMVEEEGPGIVDNFPEAGFVVDAAIEVQPEQEVVEESFFQESFPGKDAGETLVSSPAIQEPKLDIFSPDPIPEPVFEKAAPKENIAPSEPQQVREPAPALHNHETTTAVHSTFDLFGAPATTLADKFRDEKRSINDKLNHETAADKSIGSRLRLKIADLRSAIGINDRFIFINELFEGDMRTYDDMLHRLNTCASLQEAIVVFNNAKDAQGWSDELNSVERLLDFIHRRYA